MVSLIYISPFIWMLAISLLYTTLIIFRFVCYIPELSKCFIIKGCWILSKAFLGDPVFVCSLVCLYFSVCMLEWMHRFFFIDPFLHVWDEPYLIMVFGTFYLFLDFFKYFCINVHEGKLSVITFPCWNIVWFGYQVNVSNNINWAMFLMFLSLDYFEKNWY